MACPSCINARPDAYQIKRARALQCQMCMWADHDGGMWSGTAVTCTVSGRAVAVHIQSCAPSCPKGKHRADGMVKWLGLWWYGCPAPWRWPFKFSGKIPGCGCTVAGKRAWLWIKAKLVWTSTDKGDSHGDPQHGQ